MVTQGERYRRLRDFFMGSFRPADFQEFLMFQGGEFEEVVRAVNPNVAEAEYFFEVVGELNRRGLIDTEFFNHLAEERPAKRAQIKSLAESWLDEDPEALDGSRLYDVLLRLNYRLQEMIFRSFAKRFALAAFLIHGPAEHGQRWLLNRLLRRYPPSAKVVPIKLNRKSKRYNIDAHWRDLAAEVGVEKLSGRDRIAAAVSRCCRTQTVIIIIDEVDEMTPAYLNDLHQDFWKPLVALTGAHLPDEGRNRLLMILVDYQDRVRGWELNFQFILHFDPAWDRIPPVQLPRLGRFEEAELVNWAQVMQGDLPEDFQQAEVLRTILQESEGGLPELVLEAICTRCGWDQGVEKWLKY
jgi:hypothetical protein